MTLVTPQNVILTQNVITIAAKCNTNTKCNNISAKCNRVINANCNNFPTQNVIPFLMQNVITQVVITLELQVCSNISNSMVTFRNLSSVINNLYIRPTGFVMISMYPRIKIRKMFLLCHVG